MHAYENDLAYIHDRGFSEQARRAAPHLVRLLQQSGIREGLVVDLGCGSGVWAKALVDAGYQVVEGPLVSGALAAELRRCTPPRKRDGSGGVQALTKKSKD
jgi:hypothetical protein